MKEKILNALQDGVLAIQQLLNEKNVAFIQAVAQAIAQGYQEGQKIIIAGNGGSLCDASHFAEELTGQFRKARAALPAIALNDASFITCVGNDHGFETIFSRGVEAYGKEGDIFIGLTTSGNSPNMSRAFETAKEKKLTTVAFLGKTGGKLKGFADYEMIIDNFKTSDRIQEAHMCAIHIIIEIIEELLFYSPDAPLKSKQVAIQAN